MRDFVLCLVLNLWKSVCKLWHISVQTNHISSFHLPVWSVATVLGSTALGFIMFIFCLIHDYKYYLKIEHITYVYAVRTSAQSTATSPLPSVDPSAAFTSKHFINPQCIIYLVLNKITVLTKLTSKEKVFSVYPQILSFQRSPFLPAGTCFHVMALSLLLSFPYHCLECVSAADKFSQLWFAWKRPHFTFSMIDF